MCIRDSGSISEVNNAGSLEMRLENLLVYTFSIAEQLMIKQCKQKGTEKKEIHYRD